MCDSAAVGQARRVCGRPSTDKVVCDGGAWSASTQTDTLVRIQLHSLLQETAP